MNGLEPKSVESMSAREIKEKLSEMVSTVSVVSFSVMYVFYFLLPSYGPRLFLSIVTFDTFGRKSISATALRKGTLLKS